ncbi:hypothetical protein [Fodinicurvata sp. EGI_FJ10296]|uniref:hypothetical protein n=1 Tax=Fodinicurvata sp. EGI_FJ10296 TaxID=3231908 RepID=UPI0034517D39
MQSSYSGHLLASFTALCATLYVVSVVGVCLFSADWAFIGLLDLPAAFAVVLYGATGVAILAFAAWFALLAWRAELALTDQSGQSPLI